MVLLFVRYVYKKMVKMAWGAGIKSSQRGFLEKWKFLGRDVEDFETWRTDGEKKKMETGVGRINTSERKRKLESQWVELRAAAN